MALDKDDIKQINDMIGAGIKPVTDQVATIAGSITPLTEQLTQTGATLKTLTETVGKIQAAPADDKKKKGESDDAEPPPWAKDLKETVAGLIKPVSEITAEREATVKRQAAEALVIKYLRDKKLGGLEKNKAVLDRLIAGNPTKIEDVEALVTREREYAATLGIKPETFGADPAAEGGKGGDGGADTAEKKKEATKNAIADAAKKSQEVL